MLQLEDTRLRVPCVFKHIHILTLPAVKAGTKLSGQARRKPGSRSASPSARSCRPPRRVSRYRATRPAGASRRRQRCTGSRQPRSLLRAGRTNKSSRRQQKFAGRGGGRGSRSRDGRCSCEPAGAGALQVGSSAGPRLRAAGGEAVGPRPPGREVSGDRGTRTRREAPVATATRRRLSPNFGRYNDGAGAAAAAAFPGRAGLRRGPVGAALTYGGDDGAHEVEGAGEVPAGPQGVDADARGPGCLVAPQEGAQLRQADVEDAAEVVEGPVPAELRRRLRRALEGREDGGAGAQVRRDESGQQQEPPVVLVEGRQAPPAAGAHRPPRGHHPVRGAAGAAGGGRPPAGGAGMGRRCAEPGAAAASLQGPRL